MVVFVAFLKIILLILEGYFLRKMKKPLFDLIFRDKPARVLLALLEAQGATYASKLARDTDCTYPHIVKVLAEFGEAGLIRVSSTGRTKPILLTPKGKKVSARVRALHKLCGR
jgi:DNA-binding MarR family transcriptional regulator